MAHPAENSLLLEFERRVLPKHYREYYEIKRNNFFASIQAFPEIWECFCLVDAIWIQEFQDMQRASDVYRGFAMLLFYSAHSKMRTSFELALSACITEAHSILRDAIEAFAHGYRLQADPKLLDLWLRKLDGPQEKKAYEREFWENKSTGLFNGLPDLHSLWKQYSELGSHTSINSLAERFEQAETPTDVNWRFNYSGAKEDVLVRVLLAMVCIFDSMEKHFFKAFEDRLKFDEALRGKRGGFQHKKELVRQQTIKKYNIPPPTNAAFHATP
jgi:hypothetical protein